MGDSFVKAIRLFSLDGPFGLRRVRPLLAEFGWASVNCSGDTVIRMRVWKADSWSRGEISQGEKNPKIEGTGPQPRGILHGRG